MGKGIHSEQNPIPKAFLTIITPTGGHHWTWTSSDTNMNALNAVIQLPNGGDLLAVGYTSMNGAVAKRVIYRFELSLTPSSNRMMWGTQSLSLFFSSMMKCIIHSDK